MVVPAGASKRYVWLGLRCIRAVVSSTDRWLRSTPLCGHSL